MGLSFGDILKARQSVQKLARLGTTFGLLLHPQRQSMDEPICSEES
jgi:hypothetical protein